MIKKILGIVILGILLSSYGSAQASSFPPGSSSVCTSNDGTIINELYIFPNGKTLALGGFTSSNLSSSSKMYRASGIWKYGSKNYPWTVVINRISGAYTQIVDAPLNEPITTGSCE
jgi:hypothetical protein